MRIGGFPALSPFVADDAVLGAKVRELGKRVELAGSVPATTVGEGSFAALFRHELRWARTIRAVEPLGFAVSVIQFPAFWALLTMIMAGGAPWAIALWVAAILWRGVLGRSIERAMGGALTPVWLPALRDGLSMAVLLAAYMGDEVAWRGHVLHTDKDTNFTTGRVLLAPRRG
jgi:ceramide glucosyltransferase